jgi:type IV fimbrial biogenesis protein FimT
MTALRHNGFSLVELMVTLAVLGVLTTLAMPGFRLWMQNTQIRTAADAVLNGIQLARTEAIRRNKAVEFTLGDGTAWTVSQVSPPATIQTRGREEGADRAVVNITPGGATVVTFGPVGAPVANADASPAITAVGVTGPSALTGMRPLNITVSVSGSVRMCDPDPALPVGDPRRCGP